MIRCDECKLLKEPGHSCFRPMTTRKDEKKKSCAGCEAKLSLMSDDDAYIGRLQDALNIAVKALESIRNNIGFGGQQNLSAAMAKIQNALEQLKGETK